MELFDETATASHQPVIRNTLVKYYPLFVLELGIGLYSTPLFRGKEYIGIENNIEWIRVMRDKYPDMRFIHHDVGDMKSSDYMRNLSPEQMSEFRNYYCEVIIPDIRPNLLFVDHYAALRTISINALKDRFDLIIYHDSEHPYYCYDEIDTRGFTVEHFRTYPQTTLMINNNLL
jgi:hypothetical protein